MAAEINHISFELLLKAHNGDQAKALAAWRAICRLGGYGDVSPAYDGGLDAKGLMHGNEGMIAEDSLKRIQDFVAGDNPYTKTRVFLNENTNKSGE